MIYIPLNSVVMHKGELAVYRGTLHNKHTLQVFDENGIGSFIPISDFEYDSLEIVRFPSELAAAYVRAEYEDE